MYYVLVLVENFKICGFGSSMLYLVYVVVGIFDVMVDYNVKIWDIVVVILLCFVGGGEV